MPLPQTSAPILLARIADSQVGFSASAVREILRAVAISPLPGAAGVIEGAINLRGRIVPVVDVRQRLGFPPVSVAPDQYVIVLETSDRLIAVRVDDVEDVIVVAASSIAPPEALSPVLQRLDGVAATATGALVIYDADAFLTQAERQALDVIARAAA